MNKEDIFDNLSEFTAKDYIKYIRQGVVTPTELENLPAAYDPM